MKPKILIIDDDEKLTRLLTRFLGDFGFKVSSAHRPSLGLKLIKQISFDLIILDIMLPEMDGFEVCKVIRKTNTIPIIMLTARGDLTDRVVGLELGSDDYLAKPFEPRELAARINTILRRSRSYSYKPHSFGDLQINSDSRKALLKGVDLDLTTNEFAVLSLLTANPGKVLDRDEMLQELRGIDCEAFNRSVDIAVSRLRQKLNDNPKRPEFIKTVWGAGYVFIVKNDNAD
jgi:DNA-binding response OmpR family regulator